MSTYCCQLSKGTMPIITKVFSVNLKRFREEKNLSQSELADAVGVSRTSIARYETEAGGATLETMAKLARVLGVDETDLVNPRFFTTPSPMISSQILQEIRDLIKEVPSIPLPLLERIAKLDEKQKRTLFMMLDTQLDALLGVLSKKEETG